MRVAEALAHGLDALGVEVLFGLAGDANLLMLHALLEKGDVEYVAAAHEAASVAMASGYAHVTGKVGVATVTHGPGLTNTVTALVEAVKSSMPVVLISGDTPTIAEQHLQNIPQRALIESTGAGFQAARTAETVVEDLAVAARRALVEGRPVVLNVPVEMQDEDVNYNPPVPYSPPQPRLVDLDALDAALGVLVSARRPILLAGRGALGAREALVELARRLGAPLATSLRAKDLFASEDTSLGIFGSLSSPATLEVIGRSDCIVAFGASLNFHTTVSGSLLDGKAVVHCEIDPRQIGRFQPVEVGVTGDVRTVAETMLTWLDEAEIVPSDFADEAASVLAAHAVVPSELSTDTTIDIRTFVREFDAMLPPARQLVFDGGRFIIETARNLHVPEPTHFVWPLGFGSIGLGVSHAVGAAFGRRDVATVAIVGDGGFMMGGIADIHTAVTHGLGLIVLIFNDQSYGAEYIQLKNRGLDPRLSRNDWPEFSPLVRALGATAFVVRCPDDLGPLRELLDTRAAGDTVVVDVRLDPELVPDKYDPDRLT